jgi:hypothetical protein
MNVYNNFKVELDCRCISLKEKLILLFSGLSNDDCMHKMRLLTFMQIAEGKSEISYDVIQQELVLDLEQVEAFIIDGLSIYSLM